MGKNRAKYSCLFFIIDFFRGRRWIGRNHEITDESGDEAISIRRSRMNDEFDQRGFYWMAEPGIDWKASAFIKRFHASQHT